MFQLFNPIWLFAIAGIAVPLIIHLWNIKNGKTLRVGSISLLKESARQNARSLRLMDLLLLFLRCLLLILLAFLLARPYLRQHAGQAKNTGWIMIEQENLPETYTKFKPQIDSLKKAGYEFHYFNPEFKQADLAEALKQNPQPKKNPEKKNLSYWSLLQNLNQQLPAQFPVYLFTPNSLNRFYGQRPEISLNLNWKTYPSGDSVSSKLYGAYLSGSDNIRVIKSYNEKSNTHYSYQNVKAWQSAGDLQSEIRQGKLWLDEKGDSGKRDSLLVDTSVINIALYTDKYPNDLRYLKAAIEAVQSFSGRKINIHNLSETSKTEKFDQIFWLSEKPFDAALSRQLPGGVRVFLYQKGQTQQINSQLYPQVSNSAEAISLYQRIMPASAIPPSEALWQDGFGNPILSLQQKGEQQFYRFYTRFNPEWTDLVWNNDFTRLMLPFILNTPSSPEFGYNQYELRTIDATQQNPVYSAKTKISSPSAEANKDLSHIFWLAFFILFLVERWVSWQHKSTQKHV
ncbi:MAG TPA: BatA domain-containing protein [Daejeonella sp.]|nr:BatA domain-containing protein [Daejeonella sp.]